MLVPASTIWDTRIQSICAILTATGESGPELYVSATFAQFTESPARVAINPNRLYPIERIIRTTGRFAINIMGASQRDLVLRLLRVRRREPNKAAVLGTKLEVENGIPFLPQSLETVFCEVERIFETGDHTLMVARVVSSRVNRSPVEGSLFYSDVSGVPSSRPRLKRAARVVLNVTGLGDLLRTIRSRMRASRPPMLAQNTYELGGQTEKEIEQIASYGLVDDGRTTSPPPVPAVIRRKIGICVVGTNWGAFHCQLVRQANPSADLFVSGRNKEKAVRLARANRAVGVFTEWEKAIEDPRVQATIVALPFELHRPVAEACLRAGKHVLVEKPIAVTLEDADAMIDIARRTGMILMVAEDMHFRPAIREAVRQIALGAVGEPLYLLGHASGKRDVLSVKGSASEGILMDVAVHYVHAVRLLMGEPDEVFASSAMQMNTKMRGEDSVQILLRSARGWQAHVILSWATVRANSPDITIMGESGALCLWPGKPYLDHYSDNRRLLPELLSRIAPSRFEDILSHPRWTRRRIRLHGKYGTGYEDEMREFLDAVAADRPCSFAPSDARRDLEIVLTARESLRNSTVESIPKARFGPSSQRVRNA